MKHDNSPITTEDTVGIPFEEIASGCLNDDERFVTGIHQLDVALGGLTPGHLAVIAGSRGIGHRQLSLVMARNLAFLFGTPVAYISTSLSEKEVAKEVICSITHDLGEQIVANGAAVKTVQAIAGTHPPLYLQTADADMDKPIEWLCSKLVENHGVRVVFIDLAEDLEQYGPTRSHYDLGCTLKMIALKLNIAIVAVSNLGHPMKHRGGALPLLNDVHRGLRYSSDEQMLLYRPEYYGISIDEEGSTSGKAHLYVCGSYHDQGRLTFQYLKCRFQHLAHPIFLLSALTESNAHESNIKLYLRALEAESERQSNPSNNQDSGSQEVDGANPFDQILLEKMCQGNPSLRHFADMFDNPTDPTLPPL